MKIQTHIYKIYNNSSLPLYLIFIISAISLLGWLWGNTLFASYSVVYKPTAPSTAIILMLSSVLLLINYSIKYHSYIKVISALFFLLVIIISGIIVIQIFFHLNWDIENILLPNLPEKNHLIRGRMSPITAIQFIIASIGIIGCTFNVHTILKYVGAGLSLLVCVISTILIVGYLNNAPLSLNNQIIPVALPTAICFLLLSISMLGNYKMKYWTFTLLKSNPVSILLFRSYLPIVIIIIVLEGIIFSHLEMNYKTTTLLSAYNIVVVIFFTIVVISKVSNSLSTQIQTANQKVDEKEEKFRLMIKNSNDSFVLINEKGEQIYISDAATRDTGFTTKELMGPIQKVIYPADWEKVEQAWHEVLNKPGELVRVQYRHKHKIKDYIWYEAVAQNFIDNPAIQAVVVNVRDITSIKETENELIKAKEKAEESDRLKTAFLQNMSHEIRTPLNAIMGFSELLNIKGDDKIKVRKFTSIIIKRCEDLLVLINDILEIAKIESGQLPLNFEECNLNELFEELSFFFMSDQSQIVTKPISLRFQSLCDPEENIIMTDKVKLKQIFMNLITNAFKFTNEGRIEVGCKVVEQHDHMFYVSDTGIGIPADKQQMVFDRFSQINEDKTKHTGGTGLGLSIVKGLVQLLGGELILESETGKGSTFYFTVANQTDVNHPTEAKIIPEIHHENLSRKSVLIVEDDPYNAEYLKEILTGTDLNIFFAENGQKAIDQSITKVLDLVIMDIHLPDRDGYDVARQIKQMNPEAILIAQTSYGSQEEKNRAVASGCNEYFVKPIKQDEIVFLINKYLSDSLAS